MCCVNDAMEETSVLTTGCKNEIPMRMSLLLLLLLSLLVVLPKKMGQILLSLNMKKLFWSLRGLVQPRRLENSGRSSETRCMFVCERLPVEDINSGSEQLLCKVNRRKVRTGHKRWKLSGEIGSKSNWLLHEGQHNSLTVTMASTWTSI